MTLISKLKEAALKATKGKWELDNDFEIVVKDRRNDRASIILSPSGDVITSEENLSFIALANPENILLLIEKLRIATDALGKISDSELYCVDMENKDAG